MSWLHGACACCGDCPTDCDGCASTVSIEFDGCLVERPSDSKEFELTGTETLTRVGTSCLYRNLSPSIEWESTSDSETIALININIQCNGVNPERWQFATLTGTPNRTFNNLKLATGACSFTGDYDYGAAIVSGWDLVDSGTVTVT